MSSRPEQRATPAIGRVRSVVGFAVLVFFVVSGCGDPVDSSTRQPMSTTQNDDASTGSEVSSTEPGSSDPVEFDDTIAALVKAGDVCGMHREVGSSRSAASDGDSIALLRVFGRAAGEIAASGSVDPAIQPTLTVLAEQAVALADALQRSGTDYHDADVVDLLESEQALNAQAAYNEWIDQNCVETSTTR